MLYKLKSSPLSLVCIFTYLQHANKAQIELIKKRLFCANVQPH